MPVTSSSDVPFRFTNDIQARAATTNALQMYRQCLQIWTCMDNPAQHQEDVNRYYGMIAVVCIHMVTRIGTHSIFSEAAIPSHSIQAKSGYHGYLYG